MQTVDGASVDDHMVAVRRQLGNRAPKRIGPKLSDEGAYLWGYWMELHRARTGSGFGPNPLSYQEIRAWSEMTDKAISPWETRAIRVIDDAYIDAAAEAAKSKG